MFHEPRKSPSGIPRGAKRVPKQRFSGVSCLPKVEWPPGSVDVTPGHEASCDEPDLFGTPFDTRCRRKPRVSSLNLTVEAVTMPKQLFTIGDVARIYDEPEWKIWWIVDRLNPAVPRAGQYRLIPRALLSLIAVELESHSHAAPREGRRIPRRGLCGEEEINGN